MIQIAHLQVGEEKIVHMFLAERDALKRQSVCGMCSVLSLASEQGGGFGSYSVLFEGNTNDTQQQNSELPCNAMAL
jgi:hypothetical protein